MQNTFKITNQHKDSAEASWRLEVVWPNIHSSGGNNY